MADDQAFEGQGLLLQAGEVAVGGGGPQAHHGVHDALVQAAGVGAVLALEGVFELLLLQGQGAQLAAAVQGALVLVEVGHGRPGADLLPLVGEHVHDGGGLAGDHRLGPDEQSGGLHGVVHRVGIGGHGVGPVIQAAENGEEKIGTHHEEHENDHDAGDDGTLFHRSRSSISAHSLPRRTVSPPGPSPPPGVPPAPGRWWKWRACK